MIIRRLTSADLEVYLAVRTEGLTQDSNAFRVDPKDDAVFGAEAWRARLDRDYVVAAEKDGVILGIGGFARLPGVKTEHKGLIWGMYVRAEARGTDAANAIMTALLAHAATAVRQVQLTVVAANARAVAFYERHGFARYGVEPESVRMSDGGYADEALMWRRV